MATAANVVVFFIALLHVYILVLEMFLWDTPKGHRAFHLTPQLAKDTKVLAANQGLYNGFLAAGLFWGLLDTQQGLTIKVFFLVCIALAGVYGALSSNKKIIFIQTLPAVLALLLLYLS
ncbi:MAG: hypothetical protein RLZZ502_1275 [Pseudomonadota bacterium]|jgi:putative membrane protein